jgi:hypothetical protein
MLEGTLAVAIAALFAGTALYINVVERLLDSSWKQRSDYGMETQLRARLCDSGPARGLGVCFILLASFSCSRTQADEVV